MPSYYKSTERRPGRGIRKSYRHGGRNLRDEEARVIGVQDNAADELRRVRRRRPKDASEVRDRRAQLARVGSRERNARDEMRRLRGYQRGGGIDSLPRPLTGLESMMQQRLAPGPGNFPATGRVVAGPAIPMGGGLYAENQRAAAYRPTGRDQRGLADLLQQQQQLQGQRLGGPDQQTMARMAAAQPNRTINPFGLAQQEKMSEYALQRLGQGQRLRNPRGDFNPPPLTRSVSPRAGRGIAPVQRGSRPKPWFTSTQRPEYLPDSQAQFVPWARGGRVGLKTGGRIPRKKGAKFI